MFIFALLFDELHLLVLYGVTIYPINQTITFLDGMLLLALVLVFSLAGQDKAKTGLLTSQN